MASANDDDDDFVNGNTYDDSYIYGLDDAKQAPKEKFLENKKILFRWLTRIMNSMDFQYVIEIRLTPKMKEILMLCTEQLFDKLCSDLDYRINLRYLQTMGAACFLIATKLMFAYDHIYNNELEDLLIENCGGGCEKKHLVLMEADILRRTNWKGCDAYGLDHIYDDDEEEKEDKKEKKFDDFLKGINEKELKFKNLTKLMKLMVKDIDTYQFRKSRKSSKKSKNVRNVRKSRKSLKKPKKSRNVRKSKSVRNVRNVRKNK